MQKTRRTIDVATVEWTDKITKKLNEQLEPQSKSTLTKLENSLRFKGKTQSKRKLNLNIPLSPFFGEGHTKATRLSSDLVLVEKTSSLIENYKKEIAEAISNIRLSADAQIWPVEKFDRMISRIDNDVDMHAKELKGLFLEYSIGMDMMGKTYNSLVATAAMLYNDVEKVVKYTPQTLGKNCPLRYAKKMILTFH